MSSKNVLMKMTMEKNRMINEVIEKFLGHEPNAEEKKQFKIINTLSESICYHKGEFIGIVKYQADEGPIL